LYFVQSVAGIGGVGVYAVAARLGAVFLLIPNAFTIAAAPSFAAVDTAGRALLYEQWSGRLGAVSVATGAVAIIVHRPLLTLFGSEFASSGQTLFLTFLTTSMFVNAFGLNVPLLLAAGEQRLEFGATAVGAIAMPLLAIFLTPALGPVGVALATGAAAILVNSTKRISIARRLGVRFTSRDLYAIGLAGMVAVAAVVTMIHAAVGYALAAVTLLVVALRTVVKRSRE
jgi:O-antigen/teichoic acid export membrane protein